MDLEKFRNMTPEQFKQNISELPTKDQIAIALAIAEDIKSLLTSIFPEEALDVMEGDLISNVPSKLATDALLEKVRTKS